jgi:hypothetical protein
MPDPLQGNPMLMDGYCGLPVDAHACGYGRRARNHRVSAREGRTPCRGRSGQSGVVRAKSSRKAVTPSSHWFHRRFTKHSYLAFVRELDQRVVYELQDY